MIKKIATVFCTFLISVFTCAYTRPDVYHIDAQKNAVLHNNLGLQAVAEERYEAAIEEFSIAIALNPKTQATAIYFNNLGETYMKVGYYKEAQQCFEKSMKQYHLNFLFYQNLVNSYKAQGVIPTKIRYYKSIEDKSSLNMIMLGLLYIANGDKRGGIIKLDEFCMREPSLLITGAVRNYLRTITSQN